MDFHILGSLEVVNEGRVVTVSGSKQRALLALLLVHPNETLSTRSADRGAVGRASSGHGGQDPAGPRVAPAQGAGERRRLDAVLVTRDHGYQLKLDPERLDAHRFERLVVEGRAELAAGQARAGGRDARARAVVVARAGVRGSRLPAVRRARGRAARRAADRRDRGADGRQARAAAATPRSSARSTR